MKGISLSILQRHKVDKGKWPFWIMRDFKGNKGKWSFCVQLEAQSSLLQTKKFLQCLPTPNRLVRRGGCSVNAGRTERKGNERI